MRILGLNGIPKGGGGGGGFVEQEQGHAAVEHESGGDARGNDGLPEEVVYKVTKQVRKYTFLFSIVKLLGSSCWEFRSVTSI